MKPHLHTKIPWDNLKEYLTPYNSTATIFPSGACRKIHVRNKKTEIQVNRRHYIKDDMILRDRDKNLFNLLVQRALNSDESAEKGHGKKHKHHYLKHSCGTQPYKDEF